MENKNSKIETKGKINLINPNGYGRDIPAAEDLFLYVSLRTTTKTRSIIVTDEDGQNQTSNQSGDNEINFIATKVDLNSEDEDGKFTSYATTDYTEIGGLNIGGSTGNNESLGISSIDITYNPTLVPTVNIKFIDLRGSALFDISKSDLSNSQYGLFFRLPYPIFELTVKGYYGVPVTYCLHMLDWTSSFNGDTGNFEIDAKFIGFQSAFLADINLQQVIGVAETNEGQEKLNNKKIQLTPDGPLVSTPKLGDFLSDISKLQLSIENIKASVDGFDKLRDINTATSLMNSLSNLMGKTKDTFKTEVFRSPNFVTNENIISIRDLIVIKSPDKGYFKIFLDTADKVFNEYEKYSKKLNLGSKYVIDEFVKLNTPLISAITFSGFTEELYTEGSTVWNIANRDDKTEVSTIIDFESSDKFLSNYEKTFNPNNRVEVYDFSKTRERIQEILTDLESKNKDIKDSLSEEVNKKLKTRLKFNPTIKNVFTIIMNNVEVMFECIYDVAKSAEDAAQQRHNILQSRGADSDCPKDADGGYVYPFPLVTKTKDGKDSEIEQVWLGSLDLSDKSKFPEINFIDEVIKQFLKRSEELGDLSDAVNRLDTTTTDNWIPINVEDVYNNPYNKFNIRDDRQEFTDGVPNDLYSKVIERAIKLYSYSGVINNKDNPLSAYAYIDGASASSNIVTKSYKETISKNFNIDTAILTVFYRGSVSSNGIDIILNNSSTIGDKQKIKVGKYAKPIINNRVKLSVKNNEEVEIRKDKLKPNEGDIDNGILYLTKNLLYEHNISYLSWTTNFNNTIKKPTSYDKTYQLDVGEIKNLVDNGFGNEYSTDFNDDIKADELLKTLPFLSFGSLNKKYFNNRKAGNVSKIVILPKLYIVWVGYILSNVDIIFNIDLDDETIEEFKEYYNNWKDTQGKSFVKAYEEYFIDNEKSSTILSKINEEDKIVITSPKRISGDDGSLSIPEEVLRTYLTQFKLGFNKNTNIEEEKNNNLNEDSDDSIKNDDLKLSVYSYFKTIFDKWVGGTKDGKVFNSCSGDRDNGLIDYFQFVNRAWGDIGDKAVINLDSLVSLSDNIGTDLLTYVGKILRDSNFILQIFPSYINMRDENDAINMFEPKTNLDEGKTGPSYVCMLAGGNSKTLDFADSERAYYSNDGFIFEDGKMPPDFNGENTLNAFRVAFGSENQSIFKSVSLNQNESKNTAEYYRQLSNLVDKRGSVERTLQGNDLYDLFSTRSYKCKVDSLGNMNIQPLSYFQLDNVPFFRGVYMIMNVEHSITPNNMVTTFTGLRQSLSIIPIVEDATTFLNINYSEKDEIAKKLKINTLINEQKQINDGYCCILPQSNFNTNLITIESLKSLGVPSVTNEYHSYLVTELRNKLEGKSNAYVTCFLTQCLYESKNFANSIEVWRTPLPNADGVALQGTTLQKSYEGSGVLGNTETGDGLRFKGRGYLQIKGRKNYTIAAKDDISKRFITENFDVSKMDNIFNIKSESGELIKEGVDYSLTFSQNWWDTNFNDLKSGTISECQACAAVLNPKDGNENMDKRNKIYEKVLDVYNLKKFYDGGSTSGKVSVGLSNPELPNDINIIENIKKTSIVSTNPKMN